MERARRTKILVQGSPRLRADLSNRVLSSATVDEVNAPHEGLVMVALRETARNTLFNIGELLVTEAKVQIAGQIGIGIIAGQEPAAARQLAIIDAAYNAGLAETKAWEELLLAEEGYLLRQHTVEAGRMARTKVNFESMDRA